MITVIALQGIWVCVTRDSVICAYIVNVCAEEGSTYMHMAVTVTKSKL